MPRKKTASTGASPGGSPGFNEAGALCPGKRGRLELGPTRRADRFNEAGALCPGKSCLGHGHSSLGGQASMRPGHCAPEKVALIEPRSRLMGELQ